MSFVVEEVERVKQLFEEKQARLTTERDAAVAAAKGAAQQTAEAQQQVAAAAEALAAAESRLTAALADAEVRPWILLNKWRCHLRPLLGTCCDWPSVHNNIVLCRVCALLINRRSMRLWRAPRR